jgi:transposase, IS5 family
LNWDDDLNALVAEGIEVIVFRTVNDQLSLWDVILPPELLVLPGELARVDALLDDPAFFTPFAAYFDPRIGRPSVPMETYLRMMFLKSRYRLGYESLCREVGDSISWQRFCRIPLGTRVPHPTTLMKLTDRCGQAAVAGLNEALLTKAAAQKLIRTDKVRADTTVVEAAVAYPTDSGLLAKAVGGIAKTVKRIRAAGGATRTRVRDRRRSAGQRARSIAAKLRLRGAREPVITNTYEPPMRFTVDKTDIVYKDDDPEDIDWDRDDVDIAVIRLPLTEGSEG